MKERIFKEIPDKKKAEGISIQVNFFLQPGLPPAGH